MDSPSGEEEKIAKVLMTKLKDLGGKVEQDSYGNVIAKFNGSGDPIMLNAHMDTVEPGRGIKPIIKGDKITSDGKTVLGSDPKAGVAVILETLTSLKEQEIKHRALEVIFTKEEESTLGGSINLDYDLLAAKEGITFDGEWGVENICLSSPGYHRVELTVVGRSAHAGAEPEKGISAIKIAAEMISQLELGRIDDETTANIGLIDGGDAINAIPERVNIKGEIRSRNTQKLIRHTEHFKEVFDRVIKKHPGAEIDLNIVEEFRSYVLEPNHALVQKAIGVLKSMDLKPKLFHSGGATDVNIFSTHGISAIVVGTGEYEAHTTRESVLIPQMVQAAEFCEKIVQVN